MSREPRYHWLFFVTFSSTIRRYIASADWPDCYRYARAIEHQKVAADVGGDTKFERSTDWRSERLQPAAKLGRLGMGDVAVGRRCDDEQAAISFFVVFGQKFPLDFAADGKYENFSRRAVTMRIVVWLSILLIPMFGASGQAVARCLDKEAHQSIVIHVKRLNKNVVFDVPAKYPVKIFGNDSFIINFALPSANPRPIDASVASPAARLIVDGGIMRDSPADFALKYPSTVYQRTESGIDVYKGSLGPGEDVFHYVFKDLQNEHVTFSDMGEIAIAYNYARRMPGGVDVWGIVSKKAEGGFRNVDSSIARFVESMICDKEK